MSLFLQTLAPSTVTAATVKPRAACPQGRGPRGTTASARGEVHGGASTSSESRSARSLAAAARIRCRGLRAARRNVPPGTERVATDRSKSAAKAVRLQLQQALGTKVEIDDDAGVGVITVHYSGYGQLQDVLKRMGAL